MRNNLSNPRYDATALPCAVCGDTITTSISRTLSPAAARKEEPFLMVAKYRQLLSDTEPLAVIRQALREPAGMRIHTLYYQVSL